MGRKDLVNLDSVIHGCKNSPMIFENRSACELGAGIPPSRGGTLLPYVDATVTKEACDEGVRVSERGSRGGRVPVCL